MIQQKIAIVLTGPTASGKSTFALNLGRILNCEIVNSDSLQLYRELTKLTAVSKESPEIKQHLYQIIGGRDAFSVFQWMRMAKQTCDTICSRGNIPIIVGGTAMYNRLLVSGMNSIPESDSNVLFEAEKTLNVLGKNVFYEKLIQQDPLANQIRPSDTQRMLRAYCVFNTTGQSIFSYRDGECFFKPMKDYKFINICLLPPRDWLYKRCNERFIEIIQTGGIEEVKDLMALNYPSSSTIMKAIGVREIFCYLSGLISFDEMILRATQATRRYAKSQYTWFNNKFTDFQIYKDDINFEQITNFVIKEIESYRIQNIQ